MLNCMLVFCKIIAYVLYAKKGVYLDKLLISSESRVSAIKKTGKTKLRHNNR